MRRYTNRCEDAIANSYPQGMVDNTSQVSFYSFLDYGQMLAADWKLSAILRKLSSFIEKSK